MELLANKNAHKTYKLNDYESRYRHRGVDYKNATRKLIHISMVGTRQIEYTAHIIENTAVLIKLNSYSLIKFLRLK